MVFQKTNEKILGRNRAEIENFRFVFWKNWRHQNVLLKLTDLYKAFEHRIILHLYSLHIYLSRDMKPPIYFHQSTNIFFVMIVFNDAVKCILRRLQDLEKVEWFQYQNSTAIRPNFWSTKKQKINEYLVKKIRRLVKINWWFDLTNHEQDNSVQMIVQSWDFFVLDWSKLLTIVAFKRKVIVTFLCTLDAYKNICESAVAIMGPNLFLKYA